jgi:hypothetical protein
MKLLHILLISGLVAGQTNQAQLSEAARKLLRRPRTGDARLTWPDGRKKKGQIIRVTDQFVTFEAKNRSSCEDVELSKIANVHWLGTPRQDAAGRVEAAIVIGAFAAPFYLGYAIADPFRRISPPLRPLSGTWESIGDGGKSTLEFKGLTVQWRTTVISHGRYSVVQDRLHLVPVGAPETVIPFRIQCWQLRLGSELFGFWNAPRHVAPPIVGQWGDAETTVNFKPDGTFEERKGDVRKGTFVRTAGGLDIHWSDGQDWTAQIEHRQIVVRLGSQVTKYRYVPPGLDLDL